MVLWAQEEWLPGTSTLLVLCCSYSVCIMLCLLHTTHGLNINTKQLILFLNKIHLIATRYSWIISPPFLGGLSLHLNHLIASRVANYDWPFGTLPFELFGSNLDTRDLETYPRTYSGHFWNMSLFDDSRAFWVLFRKWVVSENQSLLDEGAIITPLSI